MHATHIKLTRPFNNLIKRWCANFAHLRMNARLLANHQNTWNLIDLKVLANFWVCFSIHHTKYNVWICLSSRFKGRRKCYTWITPRRPKVDNNKIVFFDSIFEIFFIEYDNCHN